MDFVGNISLKYIFSVDTIGLFKPLLLEKNKSSQQSYSWRSFPVDKNQGYKDFNLICSFFCGFHKNTFWGVYFTAAAFGLR